MTRDPRPFEVRYDYGPLLRCVMALAGLLSTAALIAMGALRVVDVPFWGLPVVVGFVMALVAFMAAWDDERKDMTEGWWER